MKKRTRFSSESPIFIAALLLLLAFVVRLPYLGDFLTIDEVKWIEGAGQFLLALRHGDLAQTYWHFFPGITTTWGEAIILWLLWLFQGDGLSLAGFVTARLADLPGLVGSMRLSGVLITALAVPGIYLLARPLLGNAVAVLGVLLLIFDPFFLGHSRLVNGDAIAAALMLLSVLAFLRGSKMAGTQGNRVARMQDSRPQEPAPSYRAFKIQYSFLLSGALGGLALLTKLPAPILIPWIGLLAGIGFWQWRSLRFWLKALLIWGVVALAVCVILWPALWVAPLTTLRSIYVDAFQVGEVGSGHDTFFLAQISDDPGWRFYPLAVAFRLTPITFIGAFLALLWLIFRRRTNPAPNSQVTTGWLLAAYVLYVILTANVSPKKLDRYVMAVFPALDLLAALGFWGAWSIVRRGWPWQRLAEGVAAALLVVGQSFFVLTNYPYLITSYNPLLGGISTAVQKIPVGWGEGMEQAAAWLNQQPDAANLRVSAWYSDSFFPYFVGQQASFSSSGKDQLAADYVVFYVNQVQRQKPYPALVRYFQQQPPAFTVYAQTEPWAWVYRAPQVTPLSKSSTIEGRAELLGLKRPNAPATAGQPLAVRFFLYSLGHLPDNEAWQVALANPAGHPVAAALEHPPGWQADAIIEYPATLPLPNTLAPGVYYLKLVLWDRGSNQPVTEFNIPPNEAQIEVIAP